MKVEAADSFGYRPGRMTLSPPQPLTMRGNDLWKHLWPWLAAAASGGLLTLCMSPWDQQWLCWLALTPLTAVLWADDDRDVAATARPVPRWRWQRWLQTRWGRAFCLGYVAGLVYIWGAFYWIWVVTEPGWILLGFYMACYVAVWSVFVATVARPWNISVPMAPSDAPPARRRPAFTDPVASPLAASPILRSRWNLWFAFLGASAWVALEWVRGWLLSGFGWNDLGTGLHANLPFIQIAEWTGVGGVSFLVVFVNIILVATVRRFALEVRLHRVRPHFDFTLTIAGMLLVFTFGVHLLQRSARQAAANPGASIPLRVAAVQAGIPQFEKWSPAHVAGILRTYTDLTAEAAATRPQLLLWPEAATPYGMFDAHPLDTGGNTFGFVTDLARRTDTNFLFGTLDYDFGSDGHAQADYNAAMLIAKGSDQPQTYRKIHLVPYGEYVPYRHDFPLFAWIVGDQVPGDFARGTEPGVFVTADPAVKVAPLICFEDTLAPLVRAPVLRGAQLLVNITNDAWFRHTAASRQQLAEATFRTVENRRPLVRCANTGVTAFLDANGRLTQILRAPDGDIFEAGVLAGVVSVPVDAPLTFYTRHGDVFSVACALAAGLAAFLGGWRRLRRLEIQRRRERSTRPVEDADLPAAVP